MHQLLAVDKIYHSEKSFHSKLYPIHLFCSFSAEPTFRIGLITFSNNSLGKGLTLKRSTTPQSIPSVINVHIHIAVRAMYPLVTRFSFVKGFRIRNPWKNRLHVLTIPEKSLYLNGYIMARCFQRKNQLLFEPGRLKTIQQLTFLAADA